MSASSNQSKKRFHVHFGTLKCLGTEDFTGYDHIVIERWQDGVKMTPDLVWEHAYEDTTHHFNGCCRFDSSLHVRVTEKDVPDFDDTIADFYIDASNIGDEYRRIDPVGRGDYEITWTDISEHCDEVHDNHQAKNDAKPGKTEMRKYSNQVSDDAARQAHKAAYHHLFEGDKRNKTHRAVRKAHAELKKTSDNSERNAIIDLLKTEINFSPLRSIFSNIFQGVFPTLILYAEKETEEYFFGGYSLAIGVALQLDGLGYGEVVATSNSVGIRPGQAAPIGVGLNRNAIGGVPGWTYGFSIPVDAELVGGITFNFDMKLEFPDLQEVTFMYGPSGSAGLDVVCWTYTGMNKLSS